MGFSAMIPAAQVDAANAALAAKGFGPENFSVPISGADGTVTHYGMNMLPEDPVFLEAVAAQPGVAVHEVEPGEVAFHAQLVAANLTLAPVQTVVEVVEVQEPGEVVSTTAGGPGAVIQE